MELIQYHHKQPRLDFDVLRLVCNCLTNVSDVLSFALTCSILRKGALQQRLRMSPVVLSDSESVDRFHRFIFTDAAARAPYIYGLKLLSSENDYRSEAIMHGRLVALLEAAIHLEYLHVPTTVGDHVFTAAAKVATLRELSVPSASNFHVEALHKLLTTLRSPLRRLRIEASESEHFPASFLHHNLAHFAPTLEILELGCLPLDISPSSVTTPFTAMRSLKTKAICAFDQLDVLLLLFPSLDNTLALDYLDTRITKDDYPALRERSKEAQKTRSWSDLDRVVCDADSAFLMALVCPIRRMDVTLSHGKQLQYLAETLHHNCPRQLHLSLSYDDDDLHALDGLFPLEAEDRLTHLVMFVDIHVEHCVDIGIPESRRYEIPETFMDKLIGSMKHLRITHLRIVFHYEVDYTVVDGLHPIAMALDENSVNQAREMDLPAAVTRLFGAMQTLQHVFLTTCGRTFGGAGGRSWQARNKWSSSKAWRAADDSNEDLRPLHRKYRVSYAEISGTEAEAVMEREELQLSRRDEDKVQQCNSYWYGPYSVGDYH